MQRSPGQRFTVSHEAPLLAYLIEIFPDRSRTSVKNLLAKGQIEVNGEVRTAFDAPLRPGDSLTVLPKALSIAREEKQEASSAVEKTGVRIVYEDELLLVVDKPAGMPVIATGRGGNEKTLYSILMAYIKTQARARRTEDRLSGEAPDRSRVNRIWIVHRIDKGTSGLLVFAKDERTRDLMQSKWKEWVHERRYTAFLEGKVEPESGAVQTWLYENPKSLKMHCADSEIKGGQLAISHYKVSGYIYRRGTSRILCSRTEFTLETGRKNQIRAHAAWIGHPICGDDKYGAVTNPIGRLSLHAGSLVFRHPGSGEVLRFRSELPAAFERFE